MENKRWFRVGDLVPIGLVLAATVAGAVWCANAAAGQILHIQTPTKELVFDLAVDREEVIVGKEDLTLVLVIEDGSAYVREADCPDQVCVHTGRLTHSGDTAACLPAGVLLTVEGDAADAPDAVAR